MKTGVVPALGSRPLRKADHDRRGVDDLADGKRTKSLLLIDQRWVFEAFGSAWHDPQVSGRVLDRPW